MNMISKQSIILFFIMIVFTLVSPSGYAQDATSTTYIQVRVDGLSCPFCAYGLEKKLKKVKGASDLVIELEKGIVSLNVPEDKKPSEEQIQKIVTDAGFTPREIKFSETPFKKEDESN